MSPSVNPFTQLLPDISSKPPMIDAGAFKDIKSLDKEALILFQKAGVTAQMLQQAIEADIKIAYDRFNVYEECNRALEHWFVGPAMNLYANVACLTAGTKIPLLDGRELTIEELLKEFEQDKDIQLYSCDSLGSPVPTKLLDVVKQGKKKKTLRVWLDNGEFVEASINHRFIKRDGSICRADELNVGDSLLPFHRSETYNGYERIWDVHKKQWISTYKMVANAVNGINLEEINKGKILIEDYENYLIVHHIDFVKKNNHPRNLRLMLSKEHIDLHSVSMVKRWNDPVWRAMMLNKNIESHNTPEYHEIACKAGLKAWSGSEGEDRRKRTSESNKGQKRSPSTCLNNSLAQQGKILSLNHKENIQLGLLKAVEEGRKENHKITKVCPVCNKQFKVSPCENHLVCCSQKCAGILQTIPKVNKICPVCYKSFQINPNESHVICCSVKCAAQRRIIPLEERICICCGETFECKPSSPKKLCNILCTGRYANEVQKNRRENLVPSNNHKITKIEDIGEQEVYDISAGGSQLFGLSAGIYIHNTTYNSIHNGTVWITAENDTYAKELNDLLERIGIEEKIFDWGFGVASLGDLFIKVNGVPGIGIVSVEDGIHPMNISRIDYEGVLVGFYETPQGNAQGVAGGNKQTLIPPWDFVHMRLLGAKRKRPKYTGDASQTEMRQIHLITGADTKQVSTSYGTSLIMDALPAYKRLRLAEDSLLLARLTRGIIKYIWKCKVDGNNMEAASSIIEQYATLITRARAVDTREGSASFDSKQNALTAIEDIFVPVWGETGDLTFDKVGGEADIRWIVDVDNLRNQLAFALACSPSLGGAFTKESSGALGSEAISELGIRFARSSRRLQRSLIAGLIRICQIHLAFMGMDPDPTLFEVHMTETSTAEEQQVQKALESGMRSFQTFMKTIKAVVGKKADMLKVWDYYNNKILKMEDFSIVDFLKSPEVLKQEEEARRLAIQAAAVKEKPEVEAGGEAGAIPPKAKERIITLDSGDSGEYGTIIEAQIQGYLAWKKQLREGKYRVCGLDYRSYLPIYETLKENGKQAINENTKDIVTELKVRGKALMEVTRIVDTKGEGWLEERDARTWFNQFGTAKVNESIDSENTSEEEAGTV